MMAVTNDDVSQLAKNLVNLDQSTHAWMSTAIQIFSRMINEDQDPSLVIEYHNGVKIEVRINKVPGMFSRETIQLKGIKKVKALQ